MTTRRRSGLLAAMMDDSHEEEARRTLSAISAEVPVHIRDQARAAAAEIGAAMDAKADRSVRLDGRAGLALAVTAWASAHHCRHIDDSSPQPVILPVGPPRAEAMCLRCGTAYLRAIMDTTEDRTCDLCGAVGDELTTGRTFLVGAAVTVSGLCSDCLPTFDGHFAAEALT